MIDNCADFCSWLTVSYGGAKGHSGAKLGSENLGFSKTARRVFGGQGNLGGLVSLWVMR